MSAALTVRSVCVSVAAEGVRGVGLRLSPPVLSGTGRSGPAASEYGRLGARGKGQRSLHLCLFSLEVIPTRDIKPCVEKHLKRFKSLP